MGHQGLEDAKLAKSVRYHVEGQLEARLREQPRVLPLRHRASRIRPGHLRHGALLAAAECRGRAADRARRRALPRMGLGDGDGVLRDDGRLLARGAHAADGRLEDAEPRRQAGRAADGDVPRRATSGATARCAPPYSRISGSTPATIMRSRPASRRSTPTTCQVDVYWFVHKDAVEGRDYDLARLMPFWQRTSEQDWEICEANQAGRLVAALRARARIRRSARPTCSISSTGISARSAGRSARLKAVGGKGATA